jgi:hypothetical protein
MLVDHLEDVSSFQAFGNNTKAVGELVEEGIFVREDIGIFNAGEDAYFIEAIPCFLLGQG